MKILHLVQCYHPVLGGSEWLVKNFSEQLVSRYRDDVTVFTTAAYNPQSFWWSNGPLMTPGIEEINGVTVRRFKIFNRLQFVRMFFAHLFHRFKLPYHDWARTMQTGPIIFNMRQEIAKSGADVVLATAFPFLHMYDAVAGARKAKIPVVLLGSIHVEDKWGYDRKMMYEAIQQADAYIALTTFERDHLIAHGIQADKITVIGGGVDANAFINADGARIRQKYGWANKPVVAVLARQSPLKRLHIVLEAMPKVWSHYPDVHLLMAGSRTSYSEKLEEMIEALPAAQQAQITKIDNFPENEKAQLLAASDLLVHPSANESFGIVFLEAWACGKPVIGAQVGVISSLIEEGKDGLLATYQEPDSMAQAILTLLADPEKRRAMGAAGQKKVLDFYTWEKVSDRLRQVYIEVTERYQFRNGPHPRPLPQ